MRAGLIRGVCLEESFWKKVCRRVDRLKKLGIDVAENLTGTAILQF